MISNPTYFLRQAFRYIMFQVQRFPDAQVGIPTLHRDTFQASLYDSTCALSSPHQT